MERGNVAKWLKKEGDKIVPGDILAEIETDKATVGFEARDEGYLAKILVPEGAKDVPVGQQVAIVVEDEKDLPLFKGAGAESGSLPPPSAEHAEASTTVSAHEGTPSAEAQTQTAEATGGKVSATPLARRKAEELGINLQQVPGSGPNNTIVAADVALHASQPAPVETEPGLHEQPEEAAAAPKKEKKKKPVPAAAIQVPAAVFADEPHSQIRKIIADRLLQSKTTIPHYYLSTECQMDALMEVRARLNAGKKPDEKLSVNDFILKATAIALRRVPALNSSWQPEFVRRFQNIDISMAVSTDFGLITPIIAAADNKGLTTIAKESKELAKKARANKLLPHEFQGGTFTVSNLGMFGVKQFCPIINPPQSAILGVGSAEQRVVAKPEDKSSAPSFGVSSFLTVTLSCDHRVVDGAVAAEWLKQFRQLIQDPISMLL